MGGAPANLAFHAARLGAEAHLISRVGDDELGDRALADLKLRGIFAHTGERSRQATGIVQVELTLGQPRYTIAMPAAYDEIETDEAATRIFSSADYFCFGTLALRHPSSTSSLEGLLKSRVASKRPTLVVDLNLREPHSSKASSIFCLEQARILKLNEDELLMLERWLDVTDVKSSLLERFKIELLLVTRGALGASLFTSEASVHQAATPSLAQDPVGAGDAFLAAFLLNLHANEAPQVSLERATRYAARVADEAGAMPELPWSFRSSCSPYALAAE